MLEVVVMEVVRVPKMAYVAVAEALRVQAALGQLLVDQLEAPGRAVVRPRAEVSIAKKSLKQ